MTKKTGSGEMLAVLGSSSYKSADARGGSINTTNKLPSARHIEVTTHSLQDSSGPPNRESQSGSAQAPGDGGNTINGSIQPPQPVIPDGNVRGRDKVVRRGGRTSSSGSGGSSKTREAEAAVAEQRASKILAKYRVDGDVRGLAELARDHGIPGKMRRVCTKLCQIVSN